jgi:hypothetical protein
MSEENVPFIDEDPQDHDPNMVDRDPPKWEQLFTAVPDTTDSDHVPKFDHDDGHWILEMSRKKRDIAKSIGILLLTALYHTLLMILTCGATEEELNYGGERYPLFTTRYSRKGPGKYKHYMKINKDDWYQISADDIDRPPDNYTFDAGVRYMPGGAVVVDKSGYMKLKPGADGAKVSPGDVGVPDVPRPKDHDLADPHIVGGLKGNGNKHGRARPEQNLKFFEEVRIVIYNTETAHRRKASMWVSNDIIVQNKADHKTEKQRVNAAKKIKDEENKAEAQKTGQEAPTQPNIEVRHQYLTQEAIENTNNNKTKYKPDKPLVDRLHGFNKRQHALNKEMSGSIAEIDPKFSSSIMRKRTTRVPPPKGGVSGDVGSRVAGKRGSVTMMRESGDNGQHHTAKSP